MYFKSWREKQFLDVFFIFIISTCSKHESCEVMLEVHHRGDQTRRKTEATGQKASHLSVVTDQRFSMPIQCTDRTAEAERAFPSALRSDIPHLHPSLASRGANQEERDLVDSLTKLSVKFPPSADSEYDFLNSSPDRKIGLAMPMERPLGSVSPTLTEEEPVELPIPFVYQTSPTHSASSSPSQESVRGPQQVRNTGEGLRKVVANYQFLIGLC